MFRNPFRRRWIALEPDVRPGTGDSPPEKEQVESPPFPPPVIPFARMMERSREPIPGEPSQPSQRHIGVGARVSVGELTRQCGTVTTVSGDFVYVRLDREFDARKFPAEDVTVVDDLVGRWVRATPTRGKDGPYIGQVTDAFADNDQFLVAIDGQGRVRFHRDRLQPCTCLFGTPLMFGASMGRALTTRDSCPVHGVVDPLPREPDDYKRAVERLVPDGRVRWVGEGPPPVVPVAQPQPPDLWRCPKHGVLEPLGIDPLWDSRDDEECPIEHCEWRLYRWSDPCRVALVQIRDDINHPSWRKYKAWARAAVAGRPVGDRTYTVQEINAAIRCVDPYMQNEAGVSIYAIFTHLEGRCGCADAKPDPDLVKEEPVEEHDYGTTAYEYLERTSGSAYHRAVLMADLQSAAESTYEEYRHAPEGTVPADWLDAVKLLAKTEIRLPEWERDA